MNAAEKRILRIAFTLFVIGLVVRFLPWGIPSIEEQNEPVKYENVVFQFTPESSSSIDTIIDTNQVNIEDDEEKSIPKKKTRKKKKKKGKVVRLPIHINSASVDELCALKGVGPKLANKIIAYREEKGAFLGPEDLEKVPGIGKKKREGILQGIIFD